MMKPVIFESVDHALWALNRMFQGLEVVIEDGGVSFETLNRQLRLHLHRGIGYMAVHGFIKRVDDLVRLTKEA